MTGNTGAQRRSGSRLCLRFEPSPLMSLLVNRVTTIANGIGICSHEATCHLSLRHKISSLTRHAFTAVPTTPYESQSFFDFSSDFWVILVIKSTLQKLLRKCKTVFAESPGKRGHWVFDRVLLRRQNTDKISGVLLRLVGVNNHKVDTFLRVGAFQFVFLEYVQLRVHRNNHAPSGDRLLVQGK